MGYAFVHTVIDDHSCVAYAEVHDDETVARAATVLFRAVAWFADCGITTRRVLADHGSAYVSHLWRETCAELGIRNSRTRPNRPQTHGKIEAINVRLEALPATTIGFRNLTNDIARSLLDNGGFRRLPHRHLICPCIVQATAHPSSTTPWLARDWWTSA